MKTKKLILLSAFCALAAVGYAQESDVDTAQNPVRQGDPSVRQSPDEIQDNGLRDMVKITEKDIPEEMETSMKGEGFTGDSKTFYRSEDGNEYAVEIKDGNTTQVYRFDKQGKPINDRRNDN